MLNGLRETVAQVPTHAQNDDLVSEVSPSEQYWSLASHSWQDTRPPLADLQHFPIGNAHGIRIIVGVPI